MPACRRHLFAILLALPFCTEAGRAQDVSVLTTAASHIEALVAPHEQAGLLSGVILVARGRQVVVSRSFGYGDWERQVPNTPEMRFGIASISKLLTEIVILDLARDGRVDLDAPVERYLREFPRGPRGGMPTVRHLMTHRAGVPHRVTTPAEEAQPLGTEDIVDRVRRTGLLFEPGSERLYSSAGFTCLARIIEIVEHRPFETVLAARVFAPAGMRRAMSETGQRLMPDRAMPYRLGAAEGGVVVKHAPYKDLRFLTGAGAVYATAEDLLHLTRAIHDSVFGDALWDETFDADATTWRGFYGRASGYEASVDVLPASDLVFVFVSNLRSASNWQVRERIRGLLLGEEAAPLPLPPPVAAPFEDPAALVGTFGPAEITFLDGSLFRGDNEFYPISGGRYYIPASGTTMRFRRDEAGAVDALISIGGSGRESVLPRQDDASAREAPTPAE